MQKLMLKVKDLEQKLQFTSNPDYMYEIYDLKL